MPFFSHSAAGMRLASVLASQGHELVVWAPERHRGEVEAWGARFELHHPTMPRTQGAGFPMELMETTQRVVGGLVGQLFGYGTEILIHDGQAPWARVAGDYLGLSRLVAHPMFPIVSPYAKPSRSDPFLPAPPDHESKARYESSWAEIADRWVWKSRMTIGQSTAPVASCSASRPSGSSAMTCSIPAGSLSGR